jgi:hypothetical protein
MKKIEDQINLDRKFAQKNLFDNMEHFSNELEHFYLENTI